MRNILFILSLLFSATLFCKTDFHDVDKKSKVVPDSLQNYEDIARFLTNKLHSDKEKARAVYIWIAHNIHYDLILADSLFRYESTNSLLTEVIEKRRGICQHYAELFNAMCEVAGVKSFVITGYTRQASGVVSNIGHAWNAVQVDSSFYLVDATWASGYKRGNRYYNEFRDDYFFIEPKEFIKTHMPFDVIWQFLDYPITFKQFNERDFSKLSVHGTFDYVALIQKYNQLDKLSQLESTNNRIINLEGRNDLIYNQISENYFQMECIRYNLVVDTLNSAVNSYNTYLMCKQTNFRRPKLEDADLKKLISDIDRGLSVADSILNELPTSDPELSIQIERISEKVPKLKAEFGDEKAYVAKYLNTKRFFRPFISPPHSNNEMLGLILTQAVRNIMYKNGNIPHVDMW